MTEPKQNSGTWFKYRNIIISIFLFLVLDTSVLVLNFYVSFQISEDAIGVNLSGRQRMLSQRMTKSLLQIQEAQSINNPERLKSSLKELKLTRGLFGETLNGFDVGEIVTGADGEPVFLKKVTSQIARESVEKTKPIWATYEQRISRLLDLSSDNSIPETVLESAVSYAIANNLTILKYMNDLTVDLEHVADSKAKRLRIIQSTGIILALINFFIIMFHFMRQLRESDAKVEAAQKETTEILETVREGLFLVDKNLIISKQHSASLEKIINIKNLADKELTSLLSSLVSRKDLDTVKGFIGLLFDKKKKENLIGELNPLDKVEISEDDGNGRIVSRYLNFKFTRVYENKEILKILVGVSDITQQVELEKRLEREQIQSNQQLEMLSSILHADMSMLQGFLNRCRKATNRINDVLKTKEKTQVALRQKAKSIFVEVHSLKGEASALNLNAFVEVTHAFEEDLKSLGERIKLSGNDFLPLIINLDRLIDINNRIDAIISRLGNFTSMNKDENNNNHDIQKYGKSENSFVAFFNNFVADICTRQDKKVDLKTDNLSPLFSNEKFGEVAKEITIQLIRNAIVHGIETPYVRNQLGKPETGTLKIEFSENNNVGLLTVSDDGAGLDYDKIRDKIVELKIKTREEADSLNTRELTAILFSSGFSTAGASDEDAGRGVGLDIISERLKQIKGKIKINTLKGRKTSFVIYIPMKANTGNENA